MRVALFIFYYVNVTFTLINIYCHRVYLNVCSFFVCHLHDIFSPFDMSHLTFDQACRTAVLARLSENAVQQRFVTSLSSIYLTIIGCILLFN